MSDAAPLIEPMTATPESPARDHARVMLVTAEDLTGKWGPHAHPSDVWVVSDDQVRGSRAVFDERAPQSLVIGETLINSLAVAELIEWFFEASGGDEPDVRILPQVKLDDLVGWPTPWSSADLIAAALRVEPPPHRREPRVRTTGVKAILEGRSASVFDISSLGMRLLAPAGTAAPGQQVGIILKLSNQVLQLTGRVVWTKDEEQNPISHIGLTLEGTAPPELRTYLAAVTGGGSPTAPRAAAAQRPPVVTQLCPACRCKVERERASTRDGDAELWWCDSCGMTWNFWV